MTKRIRIEGIKIEGIDIDTQIDSLIFKNMEIDGFNVPTQSVVEAMMNTLPCSQSRILFSLSSNDWVDTHWIIFKPHESHSTEPIVIKEIKLRSRLMEIDKIESEIAGFDFTSVRLCKAIMSWHETLRGNYTGTNIQQLKRALNSKVKSSKVFECHSSSEFPTVKDYSHLMRLGEHLTPDEYLPCREYLDTSNFIKRFCQTIDDLTIANAEIRKLELEIADIYNQIAIIAESHPLRSLHSFCCPFCGKYILTQTHKMKKPKSCGSPECDLKYDALIKRETRKAKQSDKLGGFEKGFGGARKRCIECKTRQTVNDNRMCEKCLKDANSSQ